MLADVSLLVQSVCWFSQIVGLVRFILNKPKARA